MKLTFIHLSDILDLGELANGYKLYFKSTAFINSDEDTQETIMQQLDSLFEEIKSFEALVVQRWDS